MENGTLTIALLGQPNSGKSSVFNGLTGAHQHVGNWPGKTVEHKSGSFTQNGTDYAVVDLPGQLQPVRRFAGGSRHHLLHPLRQGRSRRHSGGQLPAGTLAVYAGGFHRHPHPCRADSEPDGRCRAEGCENRHRQAVRAAGHPGHRVCGGRPQALPCAEGPAGRRCREKAAAARGCAHAVLPRRRCPRLCRAGRQPREK